MGEQNQNTTVTVTNVTPQTPLWIMLAWIMLALGILVLFVVFMLVNHNESKSSNKSEINSPGNTSPLKVANGSVSSYEDCEDFSFDGKASKENIKKLWEKIYEVVPNQNGANLNFSLTLLTPKGKYNFPKDENIFPQKITMISGDCYSFDFKCDQEVYLYIIQVDSSNKVQLLWPKNQYCELSKGKNPTKTTSVPPSGAKDDFGNLIKSYELDFTNGEELFLGIVSSEPLLAKHFGPLLKDFQNNGLPIAKGAGKFSSIDIGKIADNAGKSEILAFKPFLSNKRGVVILHCGHQ